MIDRYNFKPMYCQLADTMRQEILSGGLVADSQLPPEEELCARHGISRNTVRLTLKKLENEGLIYRVRGKGTFVKPANQARRVLLVVLDRLPGYAHASLQAMLVGLVVRAQAEGAQMQLITIDQLEEAAARLYLDGSVQVGVVFGFVYQLTTAHLELLIGYGMPYLVVGDYHFEEYHYLDIDNRAGMIDVVEHLWASGRRSFRLFTFKDSVNPHVAERDAAVLEQLASHGVVLREETEIVRLPYQNFEAVLAAGAERFLDMRPMDAVICTSDMLAAGLLKCFRRHNVGVPEEVAVTGFDDAPVAALLDPPLTSVRLDYYSLGEEAVALVFRMMDNFVNKRLRVRRRLELIRRESSAPVIAANAVRL